MSKKLSDYFSDSDLDSEEQVMFNEAMEVEGDGEASSSDDNSDPQLKEEAQLLLELQAGFILDSSLLETDEERQRARIWKAKLALSKKKSVGFANLEEEAEKMAGE